MGQRKDSESSWRIKPQIFAFRAPMLYHWASETPQWARAIMKFMWHMSCILLASAMSIAGFFVDRFLMGTQIFFYVPQSWQTKTSFSIFLPSSKLTISLISTYMGSLDSTEKARVALSCASSTSNTFLMLSRLLTYIHNSNCMQPKVPFLFMPSTYSLWYASFSIKIKSWEIELFIPLERLYGRRQRYI